MDGLTVLERFFLFAMEVLDIHPITASAEPFEIFRIRICSMYV